MVAIIRPATREHELRGAGPTVLRSVLACLAWTEHEGSLHDLQGGSTRIGERQI